jgi:adhesin transport system outer membrane protein
MYRVLATTGDLLRQLRVVLPNEAVALSDVKNEAHLPEMK